MWLMPINTTARGQTPGDEGLLFLTTGSMEGEKKASTAALKLVLPIRCVKHKKTQRKTRIYQRPTGVAKALIVLTLLKVCHTFLIIFTRIHVRAAPNVLLPNVSHRFSWEN